jgi:hypothetical protein
MILKGFIKFHSHTQLVFSFYWLAATIFNAIFCTLYKKLLIEFLISSSQASRIDPFYNVKDEENDIHYRCFSFMHKFLLLQSYSFNLLIFFCRCCHLRGKLFSNLNFSISHTHTSSHTLFLLTLLFSFLRKWITQLLIYCLKIKNILEVVRKQ